MLALKQTIKDISKAKKITQLEMAEVLGINLKKRVSIHML